jgi:hypothetical protein
MSSVPSSARGVLAWLLPGVLLAGYLMVVDRGVILADAPGDGAKVLEGGSKARTIRPDTTAKLPVQPPSRPLERHPVELVSPLTGDRVHITEHKLWEDLVKAPGKGVLYFHLAQVHGLRKESSLAVRMLRLAAKRMPAATFSQKTMLADKAFDGIRYDPVFVMYVRGLPEEGQ